jgi:catechol 2,3-dioxygenase-like lactoylglutathione lyase family enzyme
MTLLNDHTLTIGIHGPIISSSDVDAHIKLFRAFGLAESGRLERSAEETSSIWGTQDQSSLEVTLETPGTKFGVRLVQFTPGLEVQIRRPERGSDSEALKVIDFYAPDLEDALKQIEAAGFRFKDEIADYDTPEGRFREAHLWGPDGVVCALISGDPKRFENLATIRDRLVSEPQSISGPVKDQEPVLDYLSTVFGLNVIHQYGLDDESFDALVGSDDSMKLRAWNVGTTTSQPYFGIINYGLPAENQVSAFDTSRPPARGLLGATLFVRDAAIVSQRTGAPPRMVHVPGIGDCVTVTAQGPNGAWFQAVQIS